MENQWYYVQNGQRQGPVEAAELARVIRSGVAGPDPLVWRAGMPEWIIFSQIDPKSLPVELQFSSQPAPIQVGMPVGTGRAPVQPGDTLTYYTPAGDVANANSRDAKASMVLGIVSVSLLPFFCCSIFGIVAMIASLVCGILAVKFARSAGEMVASNNAVAGKVCGIIGIVASGIYIIVGIVLILMMIGVATSFPAPTTFPTTNPVFIPTPANPTTVPSN